MNIALLSTGFLGKNEATAITLIDFSKELMKSGNKVVIISEKRKESSRYEKIDGVQIYRIGFPIRNEILKSIWDIYNRIIAHTLAIRRMKRKNKAEFDIIHNFSAAPILSLRVILSKIISPNAKIIHTLKSYSRERTGTLFYRLLNYVDVITVPTAVYARKLLSFGVKKEKIKVIHSHINTHKFFPKNKQELKEKYHLSRKKVVLYYGSMWENKGTDILIRAIPYITKSSPDIVFIFIPRNMPYAKKYESSLQSLGRNTMLINQEVNIPEYVALAELVVLPYTTLIGTEGNPSCLLEAMACKTPVVTTALPEIIEIAQDCVLMAKPGDVASLAETISLALKKYPAEIVEKAYQQAQNFSVEKIAQELVQIYKQG